MESVWWSACAREIKGAARVKVVVASVMQRLPDYR
jgi:hypothetical protein